MKNITGFKKNLIKSQIIIATGLLLLTVIVYYPVRHNSFINFDDGIYVTENPFVKNGFSIDSIQWAFNPFQQDIKAAYWQPLAWISHMLDCQLFGVRSDLHHLSNLFYHVLNTLLLYLVFVRMTGAVWKSAFVAALFAIHPINVDSVAWIAERKNLLSTLFWMLTMLAYVHYAKKPSVSRYVMLLFSFVLGLMSKSMLVTLPCVLLLMDYWPLCRIQWGQKNINLLTDTPTKPEFQQATVIRLISEKLFLLPFSAAAVALSSMSLQAHGQISDKANLSIGLLISNAITSYASYLGKIIWPSNLAVFYPFPESIPIWKPILASLCLLTITIFAIIRIKKSPYLIIGWLWFLGTLFPVIGFVQGGLWPAMADRWAYVPLIGIFIIFVWGFAQLMNRFKYRVPIIVSASIIIGLVLIFATRTQVSYWKNDYTLFQHARKVTDKNYIADTFLGIALAREGKIDMAISMFSEALAIRPTNRKAVKNLADLLYDKKDYQKSLEYYLKALWLSPGDEFVLFQIGNSFVQMKKPNEAINYYKQSIQIDPSNTSFYNNLGRAYYDLGAVKNAVTKYQKALNVDPCNVDAYLNLGLSMEKTGQTKEALVNYFRALKCDPENIKIHKKIGDAMFAKGNLELAYRHYSKALSKSPKDAQIYYNLGVICYHTNQRKKAMAHFQKALKIDPGYLKAKQALMELNSEK